MEGFHCVFACSCTSNGSLLLLVDCESALQLKLLW